MIEIFTKKHVIKFNKKENGDIEVVYVDNSKEVISKNEIEKFTKVDGSRMGFIIPKKEEVCIMMDNS